MASVSEWQLRLSDPALVTTPVTRTTEIRSTPNGVLFVPIQPEVLAQQAKAQSLEQYALARVIKSEGWGGPLEQKARGLIAIGQVMLNIAGTRVAEKLLHSVFPEVSGFFGEQHGRVASTSLDPLPYHMLLATDLLMKGPEDVAGPSTHFLAPWPPNAKQNGRPLPDFERLMQEWHGEKDQLAWSGPRGLDTKAFLMFYHEPNAAKRAESLRQVMEDYKRNFGGGGLPPLVSVGSGVNSGKGMVIAGGIALAMGVIALVKSKG